MKNQFRFLLLWVGVLSIAILLHLFSQHQLFSLISLPLVLSLMAAFSLKQSWTFLVPLIIACELFSSLPPGVMTIILLIPAIIHSFTYATPNLSFSFLGLVTGIVSLQVILLALSNALRILSATGNTFSSISFQLFPVYIPLIIIMTSLISFGLTVAYQELMPNESLSSFMYKRRYS